MGLLSLRSSRFARCLAIIGSAASLYSAAAGAQTGSNEPREGDLFVGAGAAVDPNFGGILGGAVKRVRGGTISTFCESPFTGEDRWNTPHDVLVDSDARVVFLAEIGPLSNSHGVYALLRCSSAGGVAEKLAVFGVGGPLVPIVNNQWRGYPVPYPDLPVVGSVGGLHLSRKTAVLIDDEISQGKSRTTREDVYEMVISTPSAFKSVSYRPSTGEWEEGPRIVEAPRYVWSGSLPDATYYGGATYSALENVVGRDREPFRIDVKGTIGGTYFGLKLGIFGGYNEVGGGSSEGSFEEVARSSFVLDNVLLQNEEGGCPPGSIPTAVPRSGAGYNVPAGFREIAQHRLFGLVVTSNSTAASTPYLTEFGGVLLDDNPFNDGQALFVRPELACNAQRKLDFRPILPWWDPTASVPTSNEVTRLVSGKDAMYGTQSFAGRVVRVQSGDRVTTLASGLINPVGIAAYPANVPPGVNVAIVIRIDSPVNALVTDSSGRRIGVDPTGAVVNDFGEFGYVGEPGEPRVLAIREPAAGSFAIDTFGTGQGPYAVHVYSVDTRREEGDHIVVRGSAAPGSISDHRFTLSDTGSVAFNTTAPGPDIFAPVTTAAVSPTANASGWHRTDVTVTLSATDEEGGSGTQEVLFSAAGAVTIPTTAVAGNVITVPIRAEGVTTISYAARDNAGNTEATKTLSLMLDKTAPHISGLRVPEASGAEWTRSDVTVTFTCFDALSGLESCSGTPQVVTTEGAGQSRTARAVDRAGNEATAVVGGINIDKTPPSMTCTASPSLLWPSNHRLVDVRTLVSVTDTLSGPNGFVLASARSSEPDDAPGGDGSASDDVQDFTVGTPDTYGRLRAERAAGGPGRTYTFTYRGNDLAGNVGLCSAVVVVPHDSAR